MSFLSFICGKTKRTRKEERTYEERKKRRIKGRKEGKSYKGKKKWRANRPCSCDGPPTGQAAVMAHQQAMQL